MTNTVACQLPLSRAFDNNGLILAAGLLYTYQAGSLTPLATYQTIDTSAPNANPVVFDSTGQQIIRYLPGVGYKLVLKDPTGTTTLDSVDNFFAPLTNASDIGSALYPQTAAELAAGITPSNIAIPTDPTLNIRRYGALAGSANIATNLTALNNAILVAKNTASSLAGVVITVPSDCPYGYNRTTLASYPQFSGSVPIVVIDYSEGSTYAGFPTAYDGAQARYFFYTPQTTSAGQHDGNGFIVNGAWAPFTSVNNTAGLANPSVSATDNRRANFLTQNDGKAVWVFGHGTQSGANFMPGQMSNFLIQQFPGAIQNITFTAGLALSAVSGTLTANWTGLTGVYPVNFSNGNLRYVTLTQNAATATWTIGLSATATTAANISAQNVNLNIDYFTQNWMVNTGSNDFRAGNYWFKANVDGYNVFGIEGLSDPVTFVIRDQVGAANDVYFRNAAGNAVINIPSQGDALTIAKATRNASFATSFAINGVSPPAQPTGYGTPTGGAHQASFAAGSITLPNLAAAVAQLIIELKAYGIIAT